jgi:hypothetical protein
MLPGFRFLFAAIILSMSILIFGLGAAALLRAAHEEFASNPSWHATPETTFAQQGEAIRPEPTRPALAMLRVDPPVTEKSPDPVPAAAAPAEQAAIRPPPAEPEKTAAPKPEGSSLSEPATPEIPTREALASDVLASQPRASEALASEALASKALASKALASKALASKALAQEKPDIPVSASPAQDGAAPAPADTPASVGEKMIAATEQALSEQALSEQALSPAIGAAPAAEAAAAVAEPAGVAAAPDADAAATRIATLGGPPVIVEAKPPAKAAAAKPDRDAIKKQLRARQAAQRRRIAARARLARQALQLQQQTANPFAQPAVQPALR